MNTLTLMVDFRDVVSVLHAARLIKASRIFVAVQKEGVSVKRRVGRRVGAEVGVYLFFFFFLSFFFLKIAVLG